MKGRDIYVLVYDIMKLTDVTWEIELCLETSWRSGCMKYVTMYILKKIFL